VSSSTVVVALQKDQASELSLKEQRKWNAKMDVKNDHFRKSEGQKIWELESPGKGPSVRQLSVPWHHGKS
jgi:hypothetical protein